MKLLAVFAVAVCASAAGIRPAVRNAARSAMKPAFKPRSAQLQKIRPRADVAPEKPVEAPAPAAPVEKKEEWKGLESLYGGLYDGQVFETYGWDPAKLGSKASKETLLMYREAELTHGRVAMLASWGILAAERWHPLFNSPDGTAMQQAAYIWQNHPVFWFGAGLVMGAIELLRAKKVFKSGGTKESYIFRPYSADALAVKDGVEPGDLGWDPLGIKPTEKEGPGGLLERQNQEINNGRLAMLATMGILMQEATTGQPQG